MTKQEAFDEINKIFDEAIEKLRKQQDDLRKKYKKGWIANIVWLKSAYNLKTYILRRKQLKKQTT